MVQGNIESQPKYQLMQYESDGVQDYEPRNRQFGFVTNRRGQDSSTPEKRHRDNENRLKGERSPRH